ncbi:hypothetical protein B0H14DRAFT_3908057 [Mycena olivaceomarginata]|nr:hypothetical protein B0H14DRAFT_3908057 [Mycena olivaceomarginata]
MLPGHAPNTLRPIIPQPAYRTEWISSPALTGLWYSSTGSVFSASEVHKIWIHGLPRRVRSHPHVYVGHRRSHVSRRAIAFLRPLRATRDPRLATASIGTDICVYTLVNEVGTLGRELYARSTASAFHSRTYLRAIPSSASSPSSLGLHSSKCRNPAPLTPLLVSVFHMYGLHMYGLCAFQLRAATEAKILPSSCSITAYCGISTSAASTTTPTRLSSSTPPGNIARATPVH